MRGQIIKRSKGSYSIVISTGKDPDTGKYKKEWVTFHGNKTQAEQELARLLYEKDTGMYVKPGKVTFAELLERWLKDYVNPNLAPRTAEGYESITRVHLVPALGKIPLVQLKPERIQRYYSDKLESDRLNRKGLINPGTVRHHHMVIHGALKMAMKWGLVSRNVADAVEAPHEKRPEMQTMSENDIHILLEAARVTPYYALFYTAIYTGMRRSELLALRWSDVDLLLCQLSVIRTLHQLRDKTFVFRQPKTARGRRTIALPPSAALVLRAHKETQIAQRMVLGTTLKEDDLVFSEVDGKPVVPDYVSQAWHRLTEKIALEGIHLHSARHSHASLLLKQGVHPKIVQERLGHASITTTLDIYSHVAPGLQEAAAALFDKGLNIEHRMETVQKH